MKGLNNKFPLRLSGTLLRQYVMKTPAVQILKVTTHQYKYRAHRQPLPSSCLFISQMKDKKKSGRGILPQIFPAAAAQRFLRLLRTRETNACISSAQRQRAVMSYVTPPPPPTGPRGPQHFIRPQRRKKRDELDEPSREEIK